jgi:fatty acid amide hydrolase
MNDNYEQNLVNEYKQEAHKMVNSRFNKSKCKQFTDKYIQKQLDHPDFQGNDWTIEDCQSLKSLPSWQVREMLLSDPDMTLENIVNQYHLIKKETKNKSNHLTWSFYKEPIDNARELDKKVSEMKAEEIEEKLPLYGFVLSVKDSIYVKDSPSTAGLFVNLDRVPQENPETIKMLKNAGAVITSKGNIPQFLFSMESNNNLYGDCMNPFDSTRSSGGSSGGDAALIATGVVNAALGSDGAGSLRIPALFCGIDAFKPTPYRLSMHCHCNYFGRSYGSDAFPQQYFPKGDSQYIALRTIGPLARTAKDLSSILKVMYSDQKFDNQIVPMPWNENVQFKKRIGVIRKFDFLEPSAAANRALQETLDKLKEKGYEIVDFSDIQELLEEIIYWSIVVFQKNDCMLNCISGAVNFGEPLLPLYKLVKQLHSSPHFILRFLRWREGQSRRGMFFDSFFSSKNINQMSLQYKMSNFYLQLEKKMTELDLSALITIGLPTGPIRMYDSDIVQSMCCYLFIFNALNMPAGVCTVTKIREDEQVYESRHDDYITNKLKEVMKDSKGLPMGIQVVARAFQDEVVLKIMEDIEEN